MEGVKIFRDRSTGKISNVSESSKTKGKAQNEYNAYT